MPAFRGPRRGPAAKAGRAFPSRRLRPGGTGRPTRADDLADLDAAREDQAAVGATTSSRPIWARVAPSWAWATRTWALAASRRPSWGRFRPSRRSRGRPARWRARIHSGRARHWRARPRPGRRAAPPAAPGPSGRRWRAPGPARTQLPASTSTRATRPPWPAMPTGWSRRAASAPLAVTVRATSLRPGTITVTVGIWPPRALPARPGGSSCRRASGRRRAAGRRRCDRRGDDHVRRRLRAIDDDQGVGASDRGFPVHSHFFAAARESDGGSATVLH